MKIVRLLSCATRYISQAESESVRPCSAAMPVVQNCVGINLLSRSSCQLPELPCVEALNFQSNKMSTEQPTCCPRDRRSLICPKSQPSSYSATSACAAASPVVS